MNDELTRHCPDCGHEPRMVWIGFDPPEPYGEVCGCPDEYLADARAEKAAMDAPALAALEAEKTGGEP